MVKEKKNTLFATRGITGEKADKKLLFFHFSISNDREKNRAK